MQEGGPPVARRERFKSWKDALEKNRNMVVYVLALLGGMCLLAAWGLLPDVASIDPNIEGVIYRPKWQLIAMHGGMMGAFAFLFWRRPRELVYLTGYIISLGLTLMMLYTNVGVL